MNTLTVLSHMLLESRSRFMQSLTSCWKMPKQGNLAIPSSTSQRMLLSVRAASLDELNSRAIRHPASPHWRPWGTACTVQYRCAGAVLMEDVWNVGLNGHGAPQGMRVSIFAEPRQPYDWEWHSRINSFYSTPTPIKRRIAISFLGFCSSKQRLG